MTRLEKGLIAGIVAAVAISASTLGVVSTRDVTPEVTAEQVAAATSEALIPANAVYLTNQTFVCRGPVDLELVAVTIDDASTKDAVSLRSGCTGRIGRIQVTTNAADCVKIQNASLTNPVHDLDLGADGGSYCHAPGFPPVGVHRDGLQAMGGVHVTFHAFTFAIEHSALGAFAVSRAGALKANPDSNPTDIVCVDGCKLGPIKGLRIGASVSSGARDTITCGKSVTLAAKTPVLENVTVVPNNDPRCQG